MHQTALYPNHGKGKGGWPCTLKHFADHAGEVAGGDPGLIRQ